MLTEDEVRARIRDVAGYRKVGAWAVQNGLSQAYVSDFLAGKRGIGPGIINALGLEARFIAKGEECSCKRPRRSVKR